MAVKHKIRYCHESIGKHNHLPRDLQLTHHFQSFPLRNLAIDPRQNPEAGVSKEIMNENHKYIYVKIPYRSSVMDVVIFHFKAIITIVIIVTTPLSYFATNSFVDPLDC